MHRKPKLAPRNPLVATSLFRKAGTHNKPHKASRRAEKMDLRRVAQLAEQRAFTPEVLGSTPSAPTIGDVKHMGLCVAAQASV